MDDCMIHAQFESNLMWPREVRFRSTTEVYQGAEKVSWAFLCYLGRARTRAELFSRGRLQLL